MGAVPEANPRAGVIIYVYANKHYAGFAHETVRLFNQYLLEENSTLRNLQSLGSTQYHPIPRCPQVRGFPFDFRCRPCRLPSEGKRNGPA